MWFIMSAFDQDRIFASASHLPHLLSFAFMQQIIQDKQHAQLLTLPPQAFAILHGLQAAIPMSEQKFALPIKTKSLLA